MSWSECPPEKVPAKVLKEAPPAPRKKTRARRMRDYCLHLSRWGSHADAAAKAGITDRTARRWRETDALFYSRCLAALAMYEEDIFLAASYRANHPEVRPVWHRGRQVGHIARFNDTMLLRLVERLPRKA